MGLHETVQDTVDKLWLPIYDGEIKNIPFTTARAMYFAIHDLTTVGSPEKARLTAALSTLKWALQKQQEGT